MAAVKEGSTRRGMKQRRESVSAVTYLMQEKEGSARETQGDAGCTARLRERMMQ